MQRIAKFFRANLLAAVALLVGLTGVSYAVAASRHAKTLKVCQLRHSHNLVVAGKGVKCGGPQVTIGTPGPKGAAGGRGAAGATGATGATGAAGSAGPKGDTGPAGVSTVGVIYKTAADGSQIIIPADPNFSTSSSTPTHLASLQLGAGSYWITGKFYAQETIVDSSEHHVVCAVVNGADTLDSDHGTLAGINANVPFSFEAPLTLSSPATITLLCDADREATALAVKLAALQVQNLTQSP